MDAQNGHYFENGNEMVRTLRTRTRRAAATIIAGLLLATGQGIVDARSSDASAPLSEYCFEDADWYILRNYKSRKVLQPRDSVTHNGAKIVQYPERPESLSGYQYWCRISDGDYESFENVQAEKNLGIDGGSNANGAAAIQAWPTGAVNQDWLKRSTGYPAGVVALVNRKSGLCLGISGGSLNNGAQAAQFFCDGSPNQGWEIVYRLGPVRGSVNRDLTRGS
ncbi:RICIN domain-containing protein [Actinoplanes sp. NEAU-A12]|uniref:RICIN domain-containing protein n=1 Tax=Actinoplanes sandaracinus TaxID=3045177 RepID=A0ABT6WS84_9ACTN|nr:RICIN domain-containing protein [Actinoplanes sandaracinus]MDI6102594.1 RICIN domain-containing protein [Actinoplanes sandaracinus]